MQRLTSTCSGGSFARFAVPLLPDRPVHPRLPVYSSAFERLAATPLVAPPPLCPFGQVLAVNRLYHFAVAFPCSRGLI
jgi:hypothetical protein